ncbi:LTA synthase family protein [Agrobacterium sp.]|uniref:LTA synthase family protein n=1 Tax=Agrobacterium sp. TaxID=361 RepID=UPI00391AA03D
MTKSVPEIEESERAGFALSRPSIKRFTSVVSEASFVLNTVLGALLLVVILEWIARGTLTDVGSFLTSTARPGMTTVAAIFLAMIALDAIFGRHYQSFIIAVPALLIPAFISSQKQFYLSDPLYPSDMLFGRQIFQLLPAMLQARPMAAVGVFAGIVISIVAIIWTARFIYKASPSLSRTGRIWRLALAVPVLAGLGSLMEYSQYSWIRDRLNIIPMMWDQKENYRHNGFVMAFTFNIPMANVSAPDAYNANNIADIYADGSAFAVNNSKRPDVIVIMSESLWDPRRLSNVSLTPDPMPTLRATQSGNVFSPEFGGMTANVEFEALTGFSNAFLPYGSIPYQQYIRGPVPSLATFFRAEGYSAIAMHPFQEWFWNRKEVYKSFGFEEFRSEENMPAMEKRGIFASDESLFEQIMGAADSAENPLFLFAVTLQGHGPYEANRYANNTIRVDGKGNLSPAAEEALSTYAQGVNEADKSMSRLIDWAKKRNRETIIVTFGDHLPPLGRAFVESGYMPGMVATRRAPLDVMKKEHETPLVVWSSKTGTRKNIGSISPALLPYHILKTAGMDDPFYTGMLGRVQKQYPVVDRHMLVDAKQNGIADWSISSKSIPSVIRDYRLLQYDMMFGEKHGQSRFFPGFDWLNNPDKWTETRVPAESS